MRSRFVAVRTAVVVGISLFGAIYCAAQAQQPKSGETVYVMRNGKLVPIGTLRAAPDGKTAIVTAGDDSNPTNTAAPENGEKQKTPAEQNAEDFNDSSSGTRYPRVRVPYRLAPQDIGRFYDNAGGAYLYRPYGGVIAWPSGNDIVEIYEALQTVETRNAERKFNQADMNRRQYRLESAHEKMLHQGVEMLRNGSYSRAVIALTAASDLDQGDPACRIHLAQARVALGHYEDAAKVLRRALQLQPKLAYMDLNLASYYPSPEVFGEQIGEVTRYIDQSGTAETSFLLGYLRFQQGDFNGANAAFRNAAKGLGKDDLTQMYLELTKPSDISPARGDAARRAQPSTARGAINPVQRIRPADHAANLKPTASDSK